MSLESDLATLRAFLAEIELYLKSDVIYWPMGGQAFGQQMPALTLGGLLFVRRTLSARRDQLVPAQASEFDQLNRQAEAFFSRWPVNIEKKALKEISSRLNVWTATLDECTESPAACIENYHTTVNARVYLALLMPLAVSQSAETEKLRARLAALDVRLRNMLFAGEFIWEADLASDFSREEFWFLYGRPRKR
ncbi:MAG: hypothetical protein HYZ49_12070 [Chloroflexi bacterium]|nr:hypothetical protein [Chloroflexota bacterium]